MADELGRIPMSPALQSALLRARDYATAQAHTQITLEHLLLALTEDEDAAPVMQACRVDLNRLRNDVAGFLGSINERLPAGGPAEPGVSSGLTQILKYATIAAQQGRRPRVDGAIVLAALIGDGRSMAATFLTSQGLTFDQAIRVLQQGTLKAQQSAPAAPPPPAAERGPPTGRQPQDSAPYSEPSLASYHPAPGPHPTPSPTSGQLPDLASSAGTENILAAARERVEARSGARSEAGRSAGLAPPRTGPAFQDAQRARPPAAEPAPPPPPQTPASQEPVAPIDSGASPQEDTRLPAGPAPIPPRVAQSPAPSSEAPRRAETGPAGPQSQPQPGMAPPPRMPARAPASALPPPLPPSLPQAAPPSDPAGAPPSWAPQRLPGAMLNGAGGAARPAAAPGASTPPSARPALPPVPQPQERAPRPAAPEIAPWPEWADRHSPSESGGGGQPAQRPGAPPPGAPYASDVAASVDSGARALVRPPSRSRGPAIEAAHLSHSIPQRMKAGQPFVIEVRIDRPPLPGSSAANASRPTSLRSETVVARAISVRLRAAKGLFSIDPLSPETQWDQAAAGSGGGRLSSDAAVWRFSIVPNESGSNQMLLAVSARTIGADAVIVETALPDQIIPVRVRSNWVPFLQQTALLILIAFGSIAALEALRTVFKIDIPRLLRSVMGL